MYLAMDTSTDTAGIALVQDGELVAESTWHCGQNHSTQLLVRLTHLLDENELSLWSTEGIIVARGPGSYNGLRVGVSTAKGLAFSLGVPLVGISSLEAEAYRYAETGLPVCPVFNAGRNEIAVAIYQKQDNGWHQLTAEHITTLEVLVAQITAETVFCGEFVPLIVTQLREQIEKKAVIPSASSRQRVSFLAELGLKRLEAGDYDEPATLQPLYLRRPAITKPKHR